MNFSCWIFLRFICDSFLSFRIVLLFRFSVAKLSSVKHVILLQPMISSTENGREFRDVAFSKKLPTASLSCYAANNSRMTFNPRGASSILPKNAMFSRTIERCAAHCQKRGNFGIHARLLGILDFSVVRRKAMRSYNVH